MLIAEQCFSDCINAPVRHVKARAELYQGSALLDIFKHSDRLKSLSLERVADESKFYGYGICQKINVKLIDKYRELNITTDNSIEIAFGTGCDYIYTSPVFHVSQVRRDEVTNELSITAYDALYNATGITVADLGLPESYTIEEVAAACAAALGLPYHIQHGQEQFARLYPQGANFDGAENLREVLNAIAEATQTIYYIDSEWRLTFKRPDKDGAAVAAIDRDRYFSLDSGESRRLAAVCSATELGDNYISSLAVSGTTQYMRDNPFYEMRNDVAALVDNALSAIGGLTINQFETQWRGNYLLEIGDKISLETKDGKTVNSFILNDVISYDGTLTQKTTWKYQDAEAETLDNPTNLGEALKQTFAKVDKANKEIAIVASETADSIAEIFLNTKTISASVERIEETTAATLDNVADEIGVLTNRVDAAMTADGVKLSIQEELSKGIDKVYTSTGYSFDADGLKVTKTGSEMETLLDEDGLSVFRDNTEVLTADNTGVNGINMTVRQYLIVGGSRFEAYGAGRTGCFWVGG